VHFIQFVGEKVQTYEIVIDGTEDVEFVVPALLPTNDMSWVASLESSEGYSQVFETMQEQGSTLYVSFENSIWSSILGTREWNELVAQGAADQGEMLKQERHAKSPKLVGMVLASLGGVVVPVGVATLPSLIQALEDASDAQTTYDELDAKFRDHSVEGDGGVEIATYSNEVYIPSKKARTAAIIRSSVSITSGGITLGFGLIQLKIAKQRRAELPPWHPYSMDLMSEPADD
jgi:hypothetical protein